MLKHGVSVMWLSFGSLDCPVKQVLFEFVLPPPTPSGHSIYGST